MEELLRRLRVGSNGVRILTQANARLEHVKQQKIQCTESISKKVCNANFTPSLPSPEIMLLVQQKTLLKKEMEFLQGVISTFDSSPPRQHAAHRSPFGNALNSLGLGNAWDKDFVLSVLLWLFSNGQKIDHSHYPWIEHAPESIRYDRDIILCYINTTIFDYFFLENTPTHLWEDKDIVVSAVKHFPEVLRLDDHRQSRVP